MRLLRRLWSRLVAVCHRDALDRELDEEVEVHLALSVEDYLRRGVPRAEAERLARIAFGSIATSKALHRDARGIPWLEALAFDLRLALRGLTRDAAFTAAAITMLALALGLNTTIFAVVDAMLLRGFPHVVENDRLLYLQERDAAGRCCIAYLDFEEWRAQAGAFEGMGYVGSYNPIALRVDGGRASDVNAISVSANTFGLLGVQPFLGRDFVPADEVPGAPQVVVFNHRFWLTRFSGRTDVIGRVVEINGTPATVIGVMPDGFDFPTRESAWIPLSHTPELHRRGLTPGFTVVARLRDGATREQATAELDTINRQLAEAYPETNRGMVPTVASHAEMMSGQHAVLIWGSLWAAACFVLLIACASLANLTLVRTVGRHQELSIKLALGSGHARLIRQLLIEILAMATVAVPLAWWITTWCVRQWALVTESRYQILNYAIDARTLAYLSGLALASVALVVIAPCARMLQEERSLATPGARGEATDPRARRLATALVAAQMALAVVLLSSAGLLVRSVTAIVGADSGVNNPASVLVGSVRLPSLTYPGAEARRRFFDRLDASLKTLPGVASSSLATTIPVRYAQPRPLEVEGHMPQDQEPPVSFVAAGPAYFDVVGGRIVAGRAFDTRDDAAGQATAIVNESFADRYWPGQRAVGRRIRVIEREQAGPWRTVVGVVANIMQADPLRQRFKPVAYLPLAQEPSAASAWFLIRSAVPPGRIAERVRAEVRAVDPDVTLTNFGSLEERFAFDRDLMDAEHSELGKHATMTPALAAIALLLATGGLAAVMLHVVGQRTREIGVRMAVGATSADIRRLVMQEASRPLVTGILVGLVVSVGVGQVLRAELVGVSPYDPATLVGAAVLLSAIAMLACQLPASRAARVDPVITLRHE